MLTQAVHNDVSSVLKNEYKRSTTGESGRLVGRTIGHFVVRELLGRGSMASVYRAEHRVLGHSVALKILHARHLGNDTMLRRFINEARTMAAIPNPGIVAIHDIGKTDKGLLYTVMELLHGETLRQRIEGGRRLSEARTLKLARQIASAVATAHECGVIHRDIKPDNIFLVPDSEVPGGERIKLLDFGIAKQTGEGFGDLTAAGIVIGTPAYMAPEQCTPNAPVDGRADMYSLGALMYRLVTGRNVFSATDEIEVLRSHIHMAPPRPSDHGASISFEFEELIMKCLQKDPRSRFASMDDLIDNLSELESAAEISGPSPVPTAVQAVPRIHGHRTVTLAFDPLSPPSGRGTAAAGPLALPLPVPRVELTDVDIPLDDLLDDGTPVRTSNRLLWSAVGGVFAAAVVIAIVTLLGHL